MRAVPYRESIRIACVYNRVTSDVCGSGGGFDDSNRAYLQTCGEEMFRSKQVLTHLEMARKWDNRNGR